MRKYERLADSQIRNQIAANENTNGGSHGFGYNHPIIRQGSFKQT